MEKNNKVKKIKIDTCELSLSPITGICKSPALWGKNRATLIPLIYFQKPKRISKESFLEIIKSIELCLPKEYEVVFRGRENGEDCNGED